MRIYVLGSNGMLGSCVFAYLKKKGFNVIGVTHIGIDALDVNINGLINWFISNDVHIGDAIINCIGLIKQKMKDGDDINAIKINSVFPHQLSFICGNSINMLHVSTDCCFSGRKGDYKETDTPDPEDMYGISKAAGEPLSCSVIRTSVIGESTFRGSLIEWVRGQKEINGYTNHLWNGVTCLQFAKLVEEIIVSKLWWRGIRHYFSETVTKARLVRHIASTYSKDITITDTKAFQSINRTLATIYPDSFCCLKTPGIVEQLIEQRDFWHEQS